MLKKLPLAWNLFQANRKSMGTIKSMGLVVRTANKFIYREYGIGIRTPVYLKKEGDYDDLNNPVGLYNLWCLDVRLHPLTVKVDAQEPKRINILIPALRPKLIFGGYIALLNFIIHLSAQGYRVRLIICEEISQTAMQVRAECREHKLAQSVLENAELLVIHNKSEVIAVNPLDRFIGYSWTTSWLAHQAAVQVNNLPFIYFIQEHEGIFYPNDSFRAFCDETYTFRHHAIFNSHLLRKYFREKKMGVFADGTDNDQCEAHFLHAISDVRCPDVAELASREKRKLLFYARPESHAGRNIFEVGIFALRKAIESGVFDDTWEFYGIGTLALGGSLELPGNKKMHMLPKVPFREYCDMLSTFDLGLALMYAPHPSVPPLEMAAAGMISVGTYYENRSAQDMAAISGNMIAAFPSASAVADALEKAVARVDDFELRVSNAKFEWPRNWDQSFDSMFIEQIRPMLED